MDLALAVFPFRSSTLDWDGRASFAWASAGLFWYPFQTTRSENNRFNRKAGRGLLKNCEVLVARCGAANARTLQCRSRRIFTGSPIERIHRDDASGQSMRPPDENWDLDAPSARNFSSNLKPLASRIPLLFPWVAVGVVAVALPEAESVVVQQHKAADPLHALPGIEMRHD